VAPALFIGSVLAIFEVTVIPAVDLFCGRGGMPKPKKRRKSAESTDDLLRKLMIVQMGLAGVGQRGIREIVGGSISDVNQVVKHLKKSQRPTTGKG
jgi:hypothetical protein